MFFLSASPCTVDCVGAHYSVHVGVDQGEEGAAAGAESYR